MESTIDSTLLIEQIRSKKTIWDRSDRHHNNREVLDQLWDEVANKLNSDVATVKRRWKCLRDHFRIELHKITNMRAEDAMESEVEKFSTWRLFTEMQFLTPQMRTREKRSNNFVSVSTHSMLNDINYYPIDDRTLWIDFKVENNCSDPMQQQQQQHADIKFEISDEDTQMSETISVSKLLENDSKKRKLRTYLDVKPKKLRELRPKLSTEEQEKSRQIEHKELPEIQQNKSPAIEQNKLPAVQQDKLPKKQQEKMPKKQQEKISEKQQEKLPVIQHDILHEIKQEKIDFLDNLEFQDIKQEKIEIQQNLTETDEDDMAFFYTLLPHMRQLSPQQKLKCRMDIHKVIYEHLYGSLSD